MEFLSQSLKYLTGVGPKRADILQSEANLSTFEDLMNYFPYKYIDRTRFYYISELSESMSFIQIKGVIISMEKIGMGRQMRLVAKFRDKTGIVELVWFQGIRYVEEKYHLNTEYVVFGKPSRFGSKINIAHPEVELPGDGETTKNLLFQAHYSTTEKMKKNLLGSNIIRKLVHTIFLTMSQKAPLSEMIKETLPQSIIAHYKLMSRAEALYYIHFPDTQKQLKDAEYRLKFEELFYIQLSILRQAKYRSITYQGFIFSQIGESFNSFYHNHLPFPLTNAQKRVLKEIRADLGTGKQMNRLLQGDVGSGKTIVAFMVSLMAIDNNFQAAIMAPTEILATQHYQGLVPYAEAIGIKIRLLTGSTTKKNRRIIDEELTSGECSILIGTHALIEDRVVFKNLGLVVIDEQHRFGVAQRARLWAKNHLPPHILVMTATPIPRTLAMTVYGDLDVSVIDELPPGRKPIQTYHYFDNKRNGLNRFIKTQIDSGRQVYVVYPLIKESEKLDFKNLEDGYAALINVFPDMQISMVHGKLKADVKEAEMQKFVKGETQIMVATTVIEVGVNVPNASVMIIESAERFGLSQMHQLRGRVGRGAEQSYCILMSKYEISSDTRKRLEMMVKTNNGFEIAEADLALRGPGDLDGTQQSGLPFDLKIASLSTDGYLLQFVRDIANVILDNDPLLEKEEHQIFVEQLDKLKKNPINWGIIS